MKHHTIVRRWGATLLLATVCLFIALLPTAAEEIMPISETHALTEEESRPLGSTSVDKGQLGWGGETVPISYGLRVLAAREELVFTGLLGNELGFTEQDFCRAMNLSEVEYVTIRELPSPREGTLFVGAMGAGKGQVLSGESLRLLSFAAAEESRPTSATMSVSVNGSDYAVTCRLCLLDRLNYTPTVALAPAITLRVETYKGVPVTGALSAYDPEGDELTYEIVDYAVHGGVKLLDRHTGAYTYTPDPTYTGQDSFSYVVRDSYGNYSTSAVVTLQISPSPTSVVYADLEGEKDAAAILSVSVAGLMNGTRVGEKSFFKPSEPISRLEFLVTAMQAAGITSDRVAGLGDPPLEDAAAIPTALRPYVTYALQKGYVKGRSVQGETLLKPHDPISRGEAAVLLSNVIGYAVEDTVTAFADAATLPDWSEAALTSLRALGILKALDGNAHAGTTMTRGDTAAWLDQTLRLLGG